MCTDQPACLGAAPKTGRERDLSYRLRERGKGGKSKSKGKRKHSSFTQGRLRWSQDLLPRLLLFAAVAVVGKARARKQRAVPPWSVSSGTLLPCAAVETDARSGDDSNDDNEDDEDDDNATVKRLS